MAIDWSTLIDKTAGYRTLATYKDPVSGAESVAFTGLYAKLSEVLAGQPAGGYFSVTIYADTLVVDVPEVEAQGLIVAARQLDVSALHADPLLLKLGAGQGGGVAEVMVGGAGGGTFAIAASQAPSTRVTPPVGFDPVLATVYDQDGTTGALTEVAGDNTANVQSVARQSWVLNALLAGFTAATYLSEQEDAGSSGEALSMLNWITSVVGALAAGGATLSSDYAQIYQQAASLATILNVAPGAVYVPVLAGEVFSTNMTTLISLLKQYEANMATLTTEEDIAAAIATVSEGLAKSASIEEGPLSVQMSNIKANVASLGDDIRSLRQSFFLQSSAVKTSYETLETYIALEKIKEELKAQIGLAVSVISLGFDAMKIYEGDISAIGEAIKTGVEAIEQAIDVIKGLAGGGGGGDDDLSGKALELLETQTALMHAYVNSATLWNDILEGKSGSALPANPAAVTIDPTTAWDNYLAGAEAVVSGLKSEAGGEEARADELLANIRILVGYGKAISGKFSAYIAQLVHATVVQAQIKASQDVQKNWDDIAKSAKSDEQKLAALKALVQSREDVVRRSLFVSFTNYEAAYYYLNFKRPPQRIEVDMTAAEITAAQAGIEAWVQAALGTAKDGTHVKLPSSDTHIDLEFPIVKVGAGAATGGEVATLSQAEGGAWTLLWNVPIGTSQLDGVLPNHGDVAIWITEAAFFLEGVTPDDKGNVVSAVATTGTYENGFGPQQATTFVTKGLSGDFLYKAADNSVYGPWKIDTEVFMTPTPYTQWAMTIEPGNGDPSTATRLHVKLTISYMTPE